ncbi:hypothetical protein [Arthrobacter sp. NPDC057013]
MKLIDGVFAALGEQSVTLIGTEAVEIGFLKTRRTRDVTASTR